MLGRIRFLFKYETVFRVEQPCKVRTIPFGVLLICLVLSLGFDPKLALASENPQVQAPSCVLMEATTGKIVWAKNPDQRMAPASLTKVLTALIALERGDLNDKIKVGPNPPRVEGTRVYLVEGEEATLENLLYAMLLNSGNDAALAIAEHFGGSQQGFARLMNEKAAALGARNSHFVSPNGLSDPNHYTTSRDLAVIARAALQNPDFRKIVATKTRPWNGQDWQTTLINQNKLLWKYPGADGVKTGYTTEARNTLIASATRNGQSFIAVVLDEPRGSVAEQDAAALLDYGFSHFQCLRLAKKNQLVSVLQVEKNKKIDLVAARDLTIVVSTGTKSNPVGELHLNSVHGPFPSGTQVGEMIFKEKGKVVGKVPVVNRQAWPAPPPGLAGWWLRLSLAFAVLWVLVTVAKNRQRARGRSVSSRSRTARIR